MKRSVHAALFALLLLTGSFAATVLYAPSAQAIENTSAVAETASATPSASRPAPAAPAPNVPTDPSLWSSPFDWIINKILGFFGWFLAAASVLLDKAVLYTVVTAGEYIQGLSAIHVAWSVLRDVGNIILVFGFLAVGISIILNADFYGSASKMLPKLLIAAVALNFSLFITSAVIDTGNLFAAQFYKAINGSTVVGEQGFDQQSGITGHIMNTLGLATIYDISSGAANSSLVGFLGIVLILIATLVIGSLAFMLIARFVVLILLLITSPIGFVAFAVPKLESVGKQWRESLINQTLTAPVMLLLLYVALKVITDPFFLSGVGVGAGDQQGISTWGAAINAQGTNGIYSFGSLLLTFLVAMGLLLAVLYFAKELSAFGAGISTKYAGKFAFGAPAFLMSGVIGGLAFGARKSLQRWRPENPAVRRASKYILRPLEKSTFDIRNAPGVGKTIGSGLAFAGASEATTPVGNSAVGMTKEKIEKMRKTEVERQAEYEKETRTGRFRNAVRDQNHADITRILGNMSDSDIEARGILNTLLNSPNGALAVATLPQNRFDKLMQSEKISEADKNRLRTLRGSGIEARYTDTATYQTPATSTAPSHAIPSIRRPGTDMSRGEQAVRALRDSDAAQLPDNVLRNPDVYENLSWRQLLAIQRTGNISPQTAHDIGAYLRTVPGHQFMLHYANLQPAQRQETRAFWNL